MRRVQIRKVATLGTGHTPSRSVPEYWVPEECTIPWLTLADVWQVRDESRTVITETREKVSPAGVANSSAVVHPAGTVAFSRTASVGFSCILGTDMATSQDWVTWTCGPHLDPRYLLWVLRGERNQILGRTQGSTHKTIYMPDIEELTVPLPPVEDQRQIAKILDVETESIDQLTAAKISIAEAIASRFRSVVWNATEVGGAVRLGRLLESVQTGSTPGGGASEGTDGIEWATPGDLGGNLAVRPTSRRVTPEAADGLPVFPSQSVLIVGIGATAGRVAFLDRPMTGNQQMTCLVPDSAALDWRYLGWWLWARQHELRHLAPYTTLPILNNDYLKSIRILIPSLDQQRKIAAHLDEAHKASAQASDALKQSVALLRERRRSVIAAAVMGELEAA